MKKRTVATSAVLGVLAIVAVVSWQRHAAQAVGAPGEVASKAGRTAAIDGIASTQSHASRTLAVQLRAALDHGRPIASLLQEWLPHAGDDPGLSMALAQEMLECTALPANDEEFMARDPAKVAPAARDMAADDLNRRAAICDGLGNTEQARYDLVRAAASAGNLQAQLGYSFFAGPYVRSETSMVRDGIREQYKRDVVRYGQAALASRTRAAYQNAYEIHSSEVMGARDPVAAYAYLLVATQGFTPALVSRLQSEASSGMTPAQLQQANQMAAGLGSPVD